jgi:preprotein translocase subunit SecF
MAETEHKFRYLLKPGNDFKLVAKMRIFCIISFLLCAGSIGMLFVNKQVRGDYMNWTIDFKGGTEIIYETVDAADPTRPVVADPAKVRAALEDAGAEGFDVSDYSWEDDGVAKKGVLVRTPQFGALTAAQSEEARLAVQEAFGLTRAEETVSWSGDYLFIRRVSKDEQGNAVAPIQWDEIEAVLTKLGLDLKPLEEKQAKINLTPNDDTNLYEETFVIHGLDRQYEREFEEAMPEVDFRVEQSTGVGAKAGDKLRNDGIKSIFYAMVLIVLYLAFRFDIRYAPGAIVATFHDAIMVIGVFAVTWQEVSLTSVAALLTVVGFSVNDTVVIFDRIRENMAKHKDKRVERIVDISLNEVLVRSLLTSITLFFVTLMMNVFGEGLARNFAFAMNAGIIVGAYSSIFLAPPVFIWIHRRWYSGPARARRAAPAATET